MNTSPDSLPAIPMAPDMVQERLTSLFADTVVTHEVMFSDVAAPGLVINGTTPDGQPGLVVRIPQGVDDGQGASLKVVDATSLQVVARSPGGIELLNPEVRRHSALMLATFGEDPVEPMRRLSILSADIHESPPVLTNVRAEDGDLFEGIVTEDDAQGAPDIGPFLEAERTHREYLGLILRGSMPKDAPDIRLGDLTTGVESDTVSVWPNPDLDQI